MRQIEDRFNHQFHYPWVFLNDEPFTQEFRLMTAGMASGEVEYGLIEKNEWQTPTWIDTEKAQKAMEQMVKDEVIYGGSVSYRYKSHAAQVVADIDICVDIILDSFSVMHC
jgi:alpha 1,2-mannosyltransferase